MLREEALLAAPLALSALATAFAQFVERFFLSRYSDVAVAAALPGDVLAGTFAVLITATASYSSTFVAQFHGAGRTEWAVASFAQGLWLTLLSLPLFVAAVPIGCAYLDHAGHAAELLEAEKAFFSIAMPGGFLTAVSAGLSGLFLGQGRTRLVACANGVGCLVNAALVPWLVFGGFGLGAFGVAGAAGARVAAAFAVCLVLLPAVCREGIVRANLPQFRWDARLLRRLVAKGLPEGVKSFVGAIAFLAFVTAAGRLDAAALAVGSVCFAVNNIYGVVERAVAQAVTILVGRARGAGDGAAMRSAVRCGFLLVGVSAALFFAVVIPIHAGLARTLYWVFFLRGLCEGAYLVLDSALKGVGDTRFTMVAEIAAELLVWAPVVFLVLGFSPSVVLLYLTMPLWLAVGAVAFAVRWRGERWRTSAIV